jgi:hypothetical protein
MTTLRGDALKAKADDLLSRRSLMGSVLLERDLQDCLLAYQQENAELLARNPAQRRMSIGVDNTPMLQPCPHCGKPIEVGADQIARALEFFQRKPENPND